MSEWGKDGVRTALADLTDFSDLRTAEEFSGFSLPELQWNGLRFAAVPAPNRDGDLLAVVPKAVGAQGGALVSPQTAPWSTQRVSVRGSKRAGRTGASVPLLSEAAAGRAGLSSGQLTARLQAAGPPSGGLHDGRPSVLLGASSLNHSTLQTYTTAQGSAILLARLTLAKAPHAAQRAGPRSPGAGNLDAASLLSAFVQQNNDLLGTLTRNRALVVLAVLLGRVAENSGLHQLEWLLTGMLNPSFQLVQFLPQLRRTRKGFLDPFGGWGRTPPISRTWITPRVARSSWAGSRLRTVRRIPYRNQRQGPEKLRRQRPLPPPRGRGLGRSLQCRGLCRHYGLPGCVSRSVES